MGKPAVPEVVHPRNKGRPRKNSLKDQPQKNSRKRRGRPPKYYPEGEVACSTSKLKVSPLCVRPREESDPSPARPLVTSSTALAQHEKDKRCKLTSALEGFIATSTALPLEWWQALRVDNGNCCSFCGETIEGRKLLKAHVQKHVCVKCLLCHSIFHEVESFRSHLRLHSSREFEEKTLPISSAVSTTKKLSRKRKIMIDIQNREARERSDIEMKYDPSAGSARIITELDFPNDYLSIQPMPTHVPQYRTRSSTKRIIVPRSSSVTNGEKINRNHKVSLKADLDEELVAASIGSPKKETDLDSATNVKQDNGSMQKVDIQKDQFTLRQLLSTGRQSKSHSSTKTSLTAAEKNKKTRNKTNLNQNVGLAGGEQQNKMDDNQISSSIPVINVEDDLNIGQLSSPQSQTSQAKPSSTAAEKNEETRNKINSNQEVELKDGKQQNKVDEDQVSWSMSVIDVEDDLNTGQLSINSPPHKSHSSTETSSSAVGNKKETLNKINFYQQVVLTDGIQQNKMDENQICWSMPVTDVEDDLNIGQSSNNCPQYKSHSSAKIFSSAVGKKEQTRNKINSNQEVELTDGIQQNKLVVEEVVKSMPIVNAEDDLNIGQLSSPQSQTSQAKPSSTAAEKNEETRNKINSNQEVELKDGKQQNKVDEDQVSWSMSVIDVEDDLNTGQLSINSPPHKSHSSTETSSSAVGNKKETLNKINFYQQVVLTDGIQQNKMDENQICWSMPVTDVEDDLNIGQSSNNCPQYKSHSSAKIFSSAVGKKEQTRNKINSNQEVELTDGIQQNKLVVEEVVKSMPIVNAEDDLNIGQLSNNSPLPESHSSTKTSSSAVGNKKETLNKINFFQEVVLDGIQQNKMDENQISCSMPVTDEEDNLNFGQLSNNSPQPTSHSSTKTSSLAVGKKEETPNKINSNQEVVLTDGIQQNEIDEDHVSWSLPIIDVEDDLNIGQLSNNSPQSNAHFSTKTSSSALGKTGETRNKINSNQEVVLTDGIRQNEMDEDQVSLSMPTIDVEDGLNIGQLSNNSPQPTSHSSTKTSSSGVGNKTETLNNINFYQEDVLTDGIQQDKLVVKEIVRSMPTIDVEDDLNIGQLSSNISQSHWRVGTQCLIPYMNHSVEFSIKPLVCLICNFQSRSGTALCKHYRQYHHIKKCVCHNNCSINPADSLTVPVTSDMCDPGIDGGRVENQMSHCISDESVPKDPLEVIDLESEFERHFPQLQPTNSNIDVIISDDSSDSSAVVFYPSQENMPIPIGSLNHVPRSKSGEVSSCGNQISSSSDAMAADGASESQKHDPVENFSLPNHAYSCDKISTLELDDSKTDDVEEIQSRSKGSNRGAKKMASLRVRKRVEKLWDISDDSSPKKRKSDNGQLSPTSGSSGTTKSGSKKSTRRKGRVSDKELKLLFGDLPKSGPRKTTRREGRVSDKELKLLLGDFRKPLIIDDVTPPGTRITRNSLRILSNKRSDLDVSVVADIGEESNDEKSASVNFMATLHIDKNKMAPRAARLTIGLLNRPTDSNKLKIPRTVISGEDFERISWVVESDSSTAESRANDRKWEKLLMDSRSPELSQRTNNNYDPASGSEPPSLSDFEVVDMRKFDESMHESHENGVDGSTNQDPLAMSVQNPSGNVQGTFHGSSAALKDVENVVAEVNFDSDMFRSQIPTTPAIFMKDFPDLVKGQWIVSRLFRRQFDRLVDEVLVFTSRSSYLKYLDGEDPRVNIPRSEIVDEYTYLCDYRSGNSTIIPVKFEPLGLKSDNGSKIQMPSTTGEILGPETFQENELPTELKSDSMDVIEELLLVVESEESRNEDALHESVVDSMDFEMCATETPHGGDGVIVSDTTLEDGDSLLKEEILKLDPKDTPKDPNMADVRKSPVLVNGTMKLSSSARTDLDVTPDLNGEIICISSIDSDKSRYWTLSDTDSEKEDAAAKHIYKKIDVCETAKSRNSNEGGWEMLKNVLSSIDRVCTPDEAHSRGFMKPLNKKPAFLPDRGDFNHSIANIAGPQTVRYTERTIPQRQSNCPLRNTGIAERKEKEWRGFQPIEHVKEETSPILIPVPQPCCSSGNNKLFTGVQGERFTGESCMENTSRQRQSNCPLQNTGIAERKEKEWRRGFQPIEHVKEETSPILIPVPQPCCSSGNTKLFTGVQGERFIGESCMENTSRQRQSNCPLQNTGIAERKEKEWRGFQPIEHVKEETSPILIPVPQPCCSSGNTKLFTGVQGERFIGESCMENISRQRQSNCPLQNTGIAERKEKEWSGFQPIEHVKEGTSPILTPVPQPSCSSGGFKLSPVMKEEQFIKDEELFGRPWHPHGLLTGQHHICMSQPKREGRRRYLHEYLRKHSMFDECDSSDDDIRAFDHTYCRRESPSFQSCSIGSDCLDDIRPARRRPSLYRVRDQVKFEGSSPFTRPSLWMDDTVSPRHLTFTPPPRRTPHPFDRDQYDSSTSSSSRSDRSPGRSPFLNFSDDYDS